ncbi:hypothetical protein BDW59DRAFT_157180 [Aspergillus cavernicola]|uniref:F-box domain-containing protein n=1 Tax=Aspergillus cavernicola TaxID=176166 RepID=A0ABR4IZ49_9EURO
MTSCIKRALGIVRLLRRRGGYERLSPDQEPPWSLLLEFPVDILLLILPHLPLVSQACLALTCKPLYRLFCSVLDDEQLAWPRLLASRSHDKFFGSQLALPRNELLLRLEDDGRWLYCGGCLKLHPKNHYTWVSELMSPETRSCIYDAGVVDVCACLALIFADGIKLAEWLKTGAPSRNLRRSIREAFQSQMVNNRQVLFHHCSITSHADVFIRLVMRVTLDADDCLIVATTYHVYWTKPHTILGDSVDRTYGYYRLSRGKCTICDTRYHLLGCTDDGLYCVMQGVRNLGSRVAPFNRYWWHGSRDPWNAMWKLWYSRYGDPFKTG